MKLAELEKKYPGVQWRFCYNSKVKHGLELIGERVTDNSLAVCGTSPAWFMNWYGTGAQDEHEKLDRLRECKNCMKRLGEGRPVAAATVANDDRSTGGLGTGSDSPGETAQPDQAG